MEIGEDPALEMGEHGILISRRFLFSLLLFDALKVKNEWTARHYACASGQKVAPNNAF